MKNIVIIGAGFSGLSAVLALEKNFKFNKNYSIILIDRHDYHTSNANLYKIVIGEEKNQNLLDLKAQSCIPLSEILKSSKIKIKKSEVKQINLAEKYVALELEKISYEYLIVAAGSKVEYNGSLNAKNFALAFKTFKDALAIRDRLEFLFFQKSMQHQSLPIKILIIGGGYAGCELAAQIKKSISGLCKKYHIKEQDVKVTIIEASNNILPGQNVSIQQKIYNRLNQLNITIQTNSFVMSVKESEVCLHNGEKVFYDILLWTGGYSGALLPFNQPLSLNNRQQILVNENLQVLGWPNVFAIGDCSHLVGQNYNSTGIHNAIMQGCYIGFALPIILQNKKPAPFKNGNKNINLALGHKWAIFKFGFFVLQGRLAYWLRILQLLSFYKYLLGYYRTLLWWKKSFT